jgi:hypothetical protein
VFKDDYDLVRTKSPLKEMMKNFLLKGSDSSGDLNLNVTPLSNDLKDFDVQRQASKSVTEDFLLDCDLLANEDNRSSSGGN